MASSSSTPTVASTPVVVSLPSAAMWLIGTAVLAVLAYYFIGVDQGMVSIFGSDTHIHEFVHDARHFLGFPCH
jgi:Probable cobalt transporter subunit (CbtB)